MIKQISKAYYLQSIVPALKQKLGITNDFAVPRLKKIVINMGVGEPQDRRAREKVLDNVVNQFTLIAGQKPKITLARRSIAGLS